MGKRLQALLGQSMTYGAGGLAARLVGFFLVPIYLHAAGVAAFGTVELMMAAILFAAIVLRLGIVASMSRFTLGEGAAREWPPVIHTIFGFVMVASTLGVGLGLLFQDQIGRALEVDDDIVLAGLFGLWVTMNYDVMARLYRIERRARAWVTYQLVNVAITSVLTLVLVVGFDKGALGLLVGNFTGTVVVYLWVVVARRETIGMRRFERNTLRELLVFSLPLMPANIAIWGLNLADRVQVQRLADAHALGVYSAASKVALAVAVLMGAFQTAWAPFAHAVRGDEGDEIARETYREVFTYWTIVMGGGMVALSALAPPYIAAAFPESARDAIPVVPLLAAGTVLYGGYLIMNIGVTVSKRTRMTPVIASIAAAVNIGLNFWFIPEWGIVGAGITTVIGYALLLALGWANAQRSYPVAYAWRRVARIAAVATVLVVVGQALPPEGFGILVVRFLLIAAYPAALVAFGGVTRRERRRALELLRSRRRPPASPEEEPEPVPMDQ